MQFPSPTPQTSRRNLGEPRPAVAHAAASACLALALVAGSARAGEFAVTKNADTVVDSRGLVLDSTVDGYGIGINGNSFESNAITTYNGWQYTAYWVKSTTSNYIAVARRQTGAGTWQVANLTASTFSTGTNTGLATGKPSDAHNVVSLGIDQIDGTLHLAYDMHSSAFKYRVSTTGVATNPGAITAAGWSQSLFGAQTGGLVSGTTISTATYPHFFNTPTGALQFTYRTGISGNGSNWIGDYNGSTHVWGNVHQYDNGATGTYTGTVTVGDTNRNSYINGATYGPTGRLYQSFTWREGATGAANHDIAFVYSDDKGNTWKNNAGTVVGTNAANNTGVKWNINTAGLTVIPLDESQSVMNQQTQAVSSQDKFHTLMWHRDTAKTTSTGGVYVPTQSSYFDYYRDGNGDWHRNKLPGAVGSRPKMFFDGSDNAFAIYQLGAFDSSGLYIPGGDLVIAAATKASNWSDWKIIKTEAGPFVSEAQADARLLALSGILSVTMQETPANLTATTPASATNMRALDYAITLTPATDRTFQTTNGNYGNPANWTGTVVPTGNANALIGSGQTVTLNTAAGTLDNSLVVGTGGGAGTFSLSGTGSITVGGSVIVGRDGGSVGTYTQTSGSLTSSRFVVGDYYNETSGGGTSSASVTGGTLTTGELQIAMNGSANNSSFTVGGNALVNVNGEVFVGDMGNTASLVVNGGTLTVAGNIREGFNDNGSNSTVRVNGGTLDMTANAVQTDVLEVNGGTVRNLLSANTLNGTGGTLTRNDGATTTLTINDGNFAGSIQNGTGVVSLNKVTGGTLTLAGANTYTGVTTITAGALRAANGSALGTTAGNTVIAGGTSTVRLELTGDINVAEPLALGGRQPTGTGNLAPHVLNVSGTNTLSGPLSSGVGGSQYNVSSDGGKLIVTGSFVNNGTGGATDVRTLKLMGAADGEWQSALTNNAAGQAITAVTKLGAGTWALSGANTYTGVTAVSAGTLKANNAATANLLTNAGGVDLGDVDGKLVLTYTPDTSPAATVKAILDAGAVGNFASGNLRSTALAAGHVIGYGDDGVANVTVRVTLPGDANLDGQVDFNDFIALQTHYLETNTRFDQGNFNYDGVTDFNDFIAIQTNFGQMTGPGVVAFSAEQVAAMTAFGEANAVPEPVALATVALGGLLLGRRRARRGA